MTTEEPRADLSRLADSLESFVRTIGQIEDAAGALTCSEAEAIASIMEVAGYEDEANDFLVMHAIAGDDDVEDLHHELRHIHDPEQFGTAEDCGCLDYDPSDDLVAYRKETPDE